MRAARVDDCRPSGAASPVGLARVEEEREKVRQHLREKYNLEKPESVDEPEEDTDSSDDDDNQIRI